MLEARDIAAGYGGSRVLHDVSFQVGKGEVVVLLGPNGHGKTTLLRALSGIVPLDAGQVIFNGRDLSGLPAAEIVDAGIVHIPQGDLIFPEMTVLENLLVGAYAKSVWGGRDTKLQRVFDLFPRLAERRPQLARSLSGGERRMLAIGRGLMGGGRLLLVDEPSLGLAPKVVDEVYAALRKVADEGLSLLLADESANHVAGFADRVYLMEAGHLVKEGTATDILADKALLSAYLG